MDVANSHDIKTHEATISQNYGYDVHHDIYGWYVVGPHEYRDESGFNERGQSLSADHRKHFERCADAWAAAYKRAKYKARREAATFRLS